MQTIPAKSGATPRHYLPPAWATDAADRALVCAHQPTPRRPAKAHQSHSGLAVDGEQPCRADALCRCRGCKPPLSEIRALNRLRACIVIAAIIVAALLGGVL